MIDLIDDTDWTAKRGFLRRYLEFTANSEGPLVFQYWTALTILSAVAGRRFSISKGHYNVYPNLYTILIAPSGACRKTRTSALGVSLLDGIDVRRLSNKITPEALIHNLRGAEIVQDEDGPRLRSAAEGFLYASELGVLLSKAVYSEGTIELLTDWADCPDHWSYTTRKGGTIELDNVSLTLLGAIPAEHLGDALPSRVFGGGFLARILFVVQQTTPRYFPIPDPQDPVIKAQLQGFLTHLRQRAGVFVFSQDGRAWYEEWYRENRDVMGDLRLNGYYERKPDHLLRIAMLLALAEELPLDLTPELLARATATLSAIEPDMASAMKEINTTQAGKDLARVMRLFEGAPGPLSYDKVLDLLLPFMNQKSVDEALRALTQAQRLDKYISPTGDLYGRRTHDPRPEDLSVLRNGELSAED